jgi:hypothetical protein
LNKILHSDNIAVINPETTEQPFGYLGNSTKREIEWALMQNKRVYSLNPLSLDGKEPPNSFPAFRLGSLLK